MRFRRSNLRPGRFACPFHLSPFAVLDLLDLLVSSSPCVFLFKNISLYSSIKLRIYKAAKIPKPPVANSTATKAIIYIDQVRPSSMFFKLTIIRYVIDNSILSTERSISIIIFLYNIEHKIPVKKSISVINIIYL